VDDIAIDQTEGNILLFIQKNRDQLRTAADKPLHRSRLWQCRYSRIYYRYSLQYAPFVATATTTVPSRRPSRPSHTTIHLTRGCMEPSHSGFGRRATPPAHHPPQFKWISKGPRKGAASAAACIGAPLTKYPLLGLMAGD
jgi:hypothetical protein